MKYRVTHSNRDSKYIVYRKFTHKPRLSLGTKGFLSVIFLSVGIFLSIPTPEDILILGAIGKFFSHIFDVSTGSGILFATLTYKGTGIALIVAAIILGGSYIKEKLKTHVKGNVRRITKLQV